MRVKRRRLMYSPVMVLERVWIRKRVKTPILLRDFPGLEESVLFRTLMALERARLVRTYRSPARGARGRPPSFWRVTEGGTELLKVLLPYRDLWERIENRDVEAIALGIKALDRLERDRQVIFPDGQAIDARSNYFRRTHRHVWYPPAHKTLDTGSGSV